MNNKIIVRDAELSPKSLAAAVFSISAWSIVPIAVSYGTSQGSSDLKFSVMFYNLLVGFLIGLIVLAFRWKKSIDMLSQVKASKRACISLVLASIFRLSYVVFVFLAYSIGPLVDTIVLVELYPIFLVLLVPLISEKSWRLPKSKDIAFICIAFLGAALILDANFNTENILVQIGLWFAVLAGLSNAIDNALLFVFRSELEMESKADIVVFELTILSFLCFLPILLYAIIFTPSLYIPDEAFAPVLYLAFGMPAAAACWQYALYSSKSPGIASFWYLYPVISVLLAWVFLRQQISDIAIVGMLLVVFANFFIHSKSHFSLGNIGTKLFFLVAIIYCLMVEPIAFTNPEWRVIEIIGVVYAILAGFILSRQWNNANNQDNEMTNLGVCINSLRRISNYNDIPGADKLLTHLSRLVVELDNCRSRDEIPRIISEIYSIEKEINSRIFCKIESKEEFVSVTNSFYLALDKFNRSNLPSISSGERLSLNALGITFASLVLVGRADSAIGTISSIVLSAGIMIVVFSISDLVRNASTKSISSMLVNQRFLRRLGVQYYLPNKNDFPELPPTISADDFLIEKENNEGDIETNIISNDPSWFSLLLDACFYLLVAFLIILFIYKQ